MVTILRLFVWAAILADLTFGVYVVSMFISYRLDSLGFDDLLSINVNIATNAAVWLTMCGVWLGVLLWVDQRVLRLEEAKYLDPPEPDE